MDASISPREDEEKRCCRITTKRFKLVKQKRSESEGLPQKLRPGKYMAALVQTLVPVYAIDEVKDLCSRNGGESLSQCQTGAARLHISTLTQPIKAFESNKL